MKKLLLLGITCIFAFNAMAQTEFGIKAGLNVAGMSNFDPFGYKPAIYVGAFVDLPVADFMSFQPELVYSRQGSYAKEDGTKAWIRLNYINVAAIAKIRLVDKLTFDLGPQIGFLANAKIKGKEDGTTATTDLKNLFGDNKDFDFSLAMGFTYKACEKIDVSARFNLGFTEIFKENDGDKIANRVFQIGVGYRF